MSSKVEQITRPLPAETSRTELKTTPEIVFLKDHPHLKLGPQQVNTQSQIAEVDDDYLEHPLPKKTETIDHLKAIGICKSYRKGTAAVPVLTDLDIEIRRGEFTAIVGQSGSGKSTLLHLLGTLDAPDKGEIFFEGRRIDDLPTCERDLLRNKKFGMIFQFYHLLPELTALENVLSPLMIANGASAYFRNRKKFRATAMGLLETVGLSHRLKHKPRELSGGEMQRAAIARALVAEPELLLADEPTGNLDQATGQEIMKILRTLNQQHRLTIVMVTHDQSLARQADQIVCLTRGRIEK